MNNVNKKLVVRLSEGIGNQLFMYANAYSLSKKFDYNLFIDNTSGYFKAKNKIRNYELNNFLINENIASNNLKFDTFLKECKRKILKKFDKYNSNKNFLIEYKDFSKKTYYKELNLNNFSNLIFLEGHFECEKYFSEYRNNLINMFKIKTNLINNSNNYIAELSNNNSVSICVRQNRYSEGRIKDNTKSLKFTKDTINYINRSIDHIKNRVKNPKFYIWSNDFSNLGHYFNEKEFTFIDNKSHKALNDFHLFSYSKHFIVGPTSFHWWGAWLNNNPNKICIRPKNINPSNNIDFWPEQWTSI